MEPRDPISQCLHEMLFVILTSWCLILGVMVIIHENNTSWISLVFGIVPHVCIIVMLYSLIIKREEKDNPQPWFALLISICLCGVSYMGISFRSRETRWMYDTPLTIILWIQAVIFVCVTFGATLFSLCDLVISSITRLCSPENPPLEQV
jgi:hypothetical protein